MPLAENSKGLFRTPLACALLSGALAAAIREFGRLVLTSTPSSGHSIHLVLVVVTVLSSTMQLHGPVFYRRDGKIIWKCVGCAFLLTTGLYAATALMPSRPTSGFSRGLLFQILITIGVQGAMLGIFLALLYGRKKLAGICSVLGLLSSLPLFGLYALSYARYSAAGSNVSSLSTDDTAALFLMLKYLVAIGQVVLPTIPIDRAIQAARVRSMNSEK